jgi:hypothetical protein
MGTRVPRIQTDVSEPQMAQAIIMAWKDLFGTIPSKEQVALVLAQNALETGNRKKMWNFNIGNITVGRSSFDFYDDLTTNEQIKPGVWEKQNLKYRSYPSLLDGVKDYLKLLSSKHIRAWQNIITPDPTAFSKSLKQSGYYTANEAPYTRTINKLYNQFSKSDSYEQARSGKVSIPKGKGGNVPKELDEVSLPNATLKPVNDVMSILTNFLRQVAASEKQNRKLYKKLLPANHMVIQIRAEHHTDAIEFSRVLCGALNDELLARAFTHTDGEQVEVDCVIHGPSTDCYEAVKQLTSSLSEAFQMATIKLGGIEVSTQFLVNKRSSYQPIDIKTASTQYRKFLLKFV